MSKKRIGIITGGGDCPGLNTVIDALVKTLHQEYEILGFYKSYEGLLNQDYTILTPEITEPSRFLGGTILKSTNNGHFSGKIGKNQKLELKPEVLAKTLQNYHDLKLSALVVLGGDGTLTVALELQKQGLNIVGVPKSIDNDVSQTDWTFGFWSAVETATEAIDRLKTTGTSHDRIMLLEVMGRNAGWISMYAGLAGGADVILLPEIPFSYKKISNFLLKRNRPNALVVIAEGSTTSDGEQVLSQNGGKSSQPILGGVGDLLAKYLNTFSEFDVRSTQLGHLQRGGNPNVIDRFLSQQYGIFAGMLVLKNEFNCIASFENNQFVKKDLASAVASLKLVDSQSQLIINAKKLGIYFGE